MYNKKKERDDNQKHITVIHIYVDSKHNVEIKYCIIDTFEVKIEICIQIVCMCVCVLRTTLHSGYTNRIKLFI